MKKKMIALLAGLMLTLSAGSAFAYFGTTDLYMAAYDTGTNNEIIIDLGTLSVSAGNYAFTSSGTNSFSLSALGSTATAATTNVAFFGYVAGKNVFASDATPTDLANAGASNPGAQYNGAASFITSLSLLRSTATTGTTTATYTGPTSNNGYVTEMNSSITGGFGGLQAGGFTVPEQTLANLTAGTLMGIYQFNTTKNANTGVFDFTAAISNLNGVETVTVNSANAPATPIPAAIYLMGSGLLGMFGLRRKQRG